MGKLKQRGYLSSVNTFSKLMKSEKGNWGTLNLQLTGKIHKS